MQQAQDGLRASSYQVVNFTAWSSPRVRPFTASLRQPCIFLTILIAQAIQDIPGLHLAHQRCCDFVAGQQQHPAAGHIGW